MAPLKAVWLSHVITYLVCLVSIVGIGGKRKKISPKKSTKINNKRIFSFNFGSIFRSCIIYYFFR